MNTLVLLTDLENAVGGIATFNRLFVQALGELSEPPADSVSVLTLHDAAMPSDHSDLPSTMAYQGFAGNRWRFGQAALNAGRRAGRVFFGHVHLVPLAWGMPRAQKILLAHGLEVWRPLSWIRRQMVRRMDRIWAVSRYTAESVAHMQGAAPERCVVFPNTLRPRPSQHFQARAALGLREGKMVLTVSRLNAEEPYKQIDLVLETMPALLSEHPDLLYVVVGEGSDRSRLEAKSRDLGIQAHVVFTGAVSQEWLPSYYHACDLFVLPSLEEGFGIVFLEAMSHAKPCIGARAGGIPEVIVHEKTGFLTTPRDGESLKRAVNRLLEDDRLRADMGEAGRRRFEEKFAFDHFIERMRHLLSKGADAPALRIAA